MSAQHSEGELQKALESQQRSRELVKPYVIPDTYLCQVDVRSELERHRSLVLQATSRETTTRDELASLRDAVDRRERELADATRRATDAEASIKGLRDKLVCILQY